MEKTFEQKLEKLKAKEAIRQDMLAMRLAGATLQAIGEKYGRSREHVRQVVGKTRIRRELVD